MGEERNLPDPEMTIPDVAPGDASVADYRRLLTEFSIPPGNDGSEYRDHRLIGIGGIGAVYGAEDVTLDRYVAVKMLREPYRQNLDQIRKFISEARITARIDHPNIVAVHQLGISDRDGVYFSMRHISGDTLQNAIRRLREGDREALRRYTPRRLLDIFIAACNAVAAAHRKRILHCDLKPANVMIGEFGEVLVLDWGLAREFDAPAPADREHIVGTPAYMAPELVTGTLAAPDERTEVYALGTILYSILTWRSSPWDEHQGHERLLAAAASGRYLPLRPPKGLRLSAELAAICRKTMSRDRRKRYRTVEELLEDLHNYRDGFPVAAYSPNVVYRFFKMCRRHPAVPLAAITAAFALLVSRLLMMGADFTRDQLLMQSTEVNYRSANGCYRGGIASLRRLHRPDSGRSAVKLALEEKNMMERANLAMMEYASILDSAAGFSAAGKQEFVRRYGATILRRLLELRIACGDSGKLKETLNRCRRYDFFPAACRRDRHLEELVGRIREGTGSVVIVPAPGMAECTARVILPDGSVTWHDIRGATRLILPEGECEVVLGNGVSLRLNVMPGSSREVNIAEPGKKEVLVPADSFFLDLPEIGRFRCDIDAFFIAAEALPGSFTAAEAGAMLGRNEYAGCRLPELFELRKAFQPGGDDGRGFYGVKTCREPVLLRDGALWDPVSGRRLPASPGAKGKVYPVRPAEQLRESGKND